MGFESMLANAVGVIEKAYICFHDDRKTLDDYKLMSADEQKNAKSLRGASKGTAISKGTTALKGADAVLKGGGLSGATGFAASMGVGQKNNFKNTDTEKYFRVQFNPSSVSITTNVDDPTLRPTDSATNESAYGKETSVYSELSLTLIFDDTDNDDAFTENRISQFLLGNTSNPVTSAYNIGKSIAGKNARHSVRPQVEAFIGAARNSGLKRVDFIWSDMILSGTLLSVNANYTMFNPQGEPIRATATLSIVLETAGTDRDPIGIYRKSFDHVFGGKDANYNAGSATQKVGNLLNL